MIYPSQPPLIGGVTNYPSENTYIFGVMMNSSGQKDLDDPTASGVDIARYVADMTREMSAMARRADLDVIAYLLELARLEAEETVQKGDLKED